VRRLLALTSALMFLELVFFALLTPLLPTLKHELDLSTSQAGVLVATYAVGGVIGAVPSITFAARVGVRTTALAGLIVFALGSLAFAFAHGFDALLAARFVQGLGGAACWTGAMVWLLEAIPQNRRGAILGYAFGISETGAIAGPGVGGLATAVGRPATFVGVALVCLALAYATLRSSAPAPVGSGEFRLRSLLSSARVRTGMWISFLPTIQIAAIGVLAPLQQHHLGESAGAIAATFALAALIGVLVRPLVGRWSDRHGSLRTVRLGLLACCPVMLAVPWPSGQLACSLLIVLALLLTGLIWAPLMVMLTDACAAAGVSQMMAVAVFNLTWPPGNIIGSAGGGVIAQAAGQHWAWAAMALALLGGFLALARGRQPIPESGCAAPPA
jgi:predicted MFS family arabinose efflux permease